MAESRASVQRREEGGLVKFWDKVKVGENWG